MRRLFGRSSASSDDVGERKIVVGLGNPGERYARNRHHAGYMVLDALLERVGGRLKSGKSGCLTWEGNLDGVPVVLARPTSYMNETGGQVGRLVRWYKTGPEALIVIHDELDIPFGEVRIKDGGGTAGHNGLGSVASHLGKDFVRVRVGISRPRGRQDPADYVLNDFSAAERKELPEIIERASDAVERILEVGAERAMNEINTRA